MNILLSGAGGFIGSALKTLLENHGHYVAPLRRITNENASAPTWNPPCGHIHLQASTPWDAVVHLAGENIAQRWTPAAKERIRASRVDATKLLSTALSQLPHPPQLLVCASAIGYYGDRGDEILNEQSKAGVSFLSTICKAWEAAAEPARLHGIRVVHLRFGIVLGRHGAALAKMLPAFRFGLGGHLGSGQQYWSWIALEDLLEIIKWTLDHDNLRGPINAVSPGAVTNKDFTKALAHAVRRPALLPVPAAIVKLVFGEMGSEALLASARVSPCRLLQSGFSFRFSHLNSALENMLNPSQQSV